MKAIIILILIFVSVSCQKKKLHSFDIKNYSKTEKSLNFPLSVNCKNQEVGHFTFTSRVLVHNRFVEFKKIMEKPKVLVADQLKYLDGYFDNYIGNGIRVVPQFEEKIKILSIEKATYPFNIDIKKDQVQSKLYSTDRIKNQFTKGDKALIVKYKATIKVSRCGSDISLKNKTHELILPLDPYLAYWYVPQNKWLLKKFSPQHHLITTPCSSIIMAELKFPSMYWNTWKPKAKTKDYDCNQLLVKNKHIIKINSSFKSIKVLPKKLDFSFLNKKDKIKISLINGLLFPVQTKINLERMKPLLKNINSLELIKKKLYIEQDISLLATFNFIKLMKRLATNLNWKVETYNDHFVLKTKGHLEHSKKPIELEIYIGPSVKYQKGRKHWNFLSNALESSDFIFYSGHSGMGTSFTIKNLKKNSTFKSFEKSPENQFIAILSCSSISYFGNDFVLKRKELGKTTDLLLTGFDNHSYRLIPAMLQYIDLELAGEKYDLHEILQRNLNRNEDVHLTRN
jgi:hypothetical protein